MPEQPKDKPATADDATVVREDDATVVRSETAETATADDATVAWNPDDAAATELNRSDPAKTTVYRENESQSDGDAATVVNADEGEVTRPASTYSTAKFLEEDAREAADLEVGAIVKDRFVIEKILGRGGMGVVYLALDLRKQEARDRNPYVALKALSDSYQRDEKMVISLQRESQKAQSLAHPNIATVYDFDRQGSLVYLTMEVLTGSPLDDFIKDHPTGLPEERVAPIVQRLEAEVTELDLVAAGCDAADASAVHLAMLDSLGHQHG